MAYVTQKGSWRKKTPFTSMYFSSGTAQPTKPVYHGPMIPKFSVVKPYLRKLAMCNTSLHPAPFLEIGLLVPPCVPLLASNFSGTCSMATLSPSHLTSPLLFMGPFLSGVTQVWSPHLSQHFWLWLNPLVGKPRCKLTEPVKMKARKDSPCYHLVLSLSPLTSEWLRLTRTSGDHPVWPHGQSRVNYSRLLRILSSQVWNTSKDGDNGELHVGSSII